MSRREATISAIGIFLIALAVRLWAMTIITFPRPEDVAYYVGVASHLIHGQGLTTDAIWSFGTPPLSFPRQAFEVWLPLPTLLAAIPMAILGGAFAAAQWSSVIVGSIVPVLAWRMGADIAAERRLPAGRARTLALGAGLSAAVYLPLVLHSVQPDSTMPFAALVLAACLLMARVLRPGATGMGGRPRWLDRRLLALGALFGLAALTRNEAIWLALVWAFLARRATGAHAGPWLRLMAAPALVSIAIFVPWALRDWAAFGSPFPGQALVNAYSLSGRDIFAWRETPTLARYLAAGPATLVALRWSGLVHNVRDVLLLLGVPISAIGLVALPWASRGPAMRPLLLMSVITFTFTTLLFPVSTTWGTFLHAAGAIHVLLILSALVALDGSIAHLARRRAWTRPVAWLGPAFTVSAALLLTLALLPADGRQGSAMARRFGDLPARLVAAGVPLQPAHTPVITDTPIWFASQTGVRAIALPDESPARVLDLAGRFGAEVLLVSAANEGIWPEILEERGPGSGCFTPVPLPRDPSGTDDILAFRIRCP